MVVRGRVHDATVLLAMGRQFSHNAGRSIDFLYMFVVVVAS